MSYISTYNPDRYTDIEWITSQLGDLRPGAVLELSRFENKNALRRTRELLYEWLHHNSLKPRFRIKVNGPLGRLEIIRLGSSQGAISSLRQAEDADLEPLLEELILLEPEDPEDVILKWKTEGRITTLSDCSRLLDRYDAVME